MHVSFVHDIRKVISLEYDTLLLEPVHRAVDIVHEIEPLKDQGWGRVTSLEIPGEITVALYEPRHPTALSLAIEQANR